MTIRMTVAAFVMAVSWAQAQPATTPPAPLPGNAMPPFPEMASRAQVEGPIEFELDIDAAGKVTHVSVLSVPQAELGFEEVAQKTLATWQFKPAQRDGQPVATKQRGRVDMVFAYASHRARMFPKRSFEEVWNAVEKAVAKVGFESYGGDPADGVLVTPVKKIKGDDIQLHVFVPSWARPVRIYLGSIQDDRTLLGKSDRRIFSSPTIGAAFFDAVAAALGEPGGPVPQLFRRRIQVAERYVGAEDPAIVCLRRVAANMPPPGDARFKPPVVISEVQNEVGIDRSLGPGTARRIVIDGEVAEDGHFRPNKVAEGGQMDEQFLVAALGPAAMWRFRPATIDGCAVPSLHQIATTFTTRSAQ